MALTGARRWAYQAFRALPSPMRGLGETVLRLRAEREVSGQAGFVAGADRRLVIGPLNTAGQGERWARAAETLPGVSARAMSLERRTSGSGFGYPSDWHLSQAALLRGMQPHVTRVLGQGGHFGATHVLAESAWAVLEDPYQRRIDEDLESLWGGPAGSGARGGGLELAVLIHGSEMRDLHRHAETHPFSPFRGAWDERWERMQATVERTRGVLQRVVERAESEGRTVPLFVPTPDMLEHVPGSTLLPITADVDRFAPGASRTVLERERPVVLHAPSNPRLKGTEAVEEVLLRLQDEGLIAYRRLSGVPHAQMPGFIADADVVVDQIVLGNVATLAAEAMAARRLVIGHVSADVRAMSPGLPVLEADPSTLEEVIRGVVADRSSSQELAARGPAWAREHHDGRAAARVLEGWLRSR